MGVAHSANSDVMQLRRRYPAHTANWVDLYSDFLKPEFAERLRSKVQSLIEYRLLSQCQESLLSLMKELQPWQQHSLLRLLKRLEPVYQQELLHFLEGEKAEYRKAWLDIFEAVEPEDKYKMYALYSPLPRRLYEVEELLRVLGGLKPLENKGLLSLLEVQKSLDQSLDSNGFSGRREPLGQKMLPLLSRLEGRQPLSLLEQALRLLRGLEPLEQKMLLRLLEGQKSLLEQALRLLRGLDPHEQGKLLLSLLERHECDQQKLLNLLEKLKQLGQLRLLEGLERPDLSKVLRLVEQLDTVGRLKQLKWLELLPAESRMIKLKKPLKLLRILETAKPPKKVIIMRQLRMELARLEKQHWQIQEEVRQERLKQLLELARLEKQRQEKIKQERLQRLLEEYKILLQQLVEWLIVYLSENGGRGSGLTHLLLDAWWLEFWELVLLAAGDVERNPGPRRMTDEQLAKIDSRALRKDGDLHKVFDAVYDCRAKWYNLCLALQVSDDDLSAIKREHRDIATCLLRGISLWLQRLHSYGPPTWRVLVDAIANSSGGDNHVLALDIADKHQAITTVSSCRHTCADHESADYKKSKEMSSTFNGMYRSIVKHLRVNVCKVRDSLCFLTDPRHPDQLCVPLSVYEDVTTTKELLTRLCPRYVNPVNTFVLEEIVREFGSQKCKRLLQDYTDKYMQ